MTFDADNLRTLKKRIGSSLFPFYRRALAREGALAELNNELCASFFVQDQNGALKTRLG